MSRGQNTSFRRVPWPEHVFHTCRVARTRLSDVSHGQNTSFECIRLSRTHLPGMGIRREHIVKTPEHVSGASSPAQNTSYLVEHIFTQRANTSPTRLLAAPVWESEHIFKTSSCASAALPRIVRASGSEHHTRRGDCKLSHWQHVARGLPSAARHWWPPSGVPPLPPPAASDWRLPIGGLQWRSGPLPFSGVRAFCRSVTQGGFRNAGQPAVCWAQRRHPSPTGASLLAGPAMI